MGGKMKTEIKMAASVLLAAFALTALSCSFCEDKGEDTKKETTDTEPAAENGGEVSKNPYTEVLPDAVDFVSYQIPVIEKNENGLYVQKYKPYKVYGITTTFQTATPYSPSYRLPSDAVMVYNNNMSSFVDNWSEQRDNYEIHAMTALVWGHTEYTQRNPEYLEDVQTRADGSFIVHTQPDNYYMVPTRRYIEYMKELVGTTIDRLKPGAIVFEEPDMWAASGYSEGFKREWREYYGTDWEPQTASPGAMYRTMRLKVYLIERLLTELSKFVKQKSPETKVYIATHSTVSYNSISIVAGLNNYLALGCIDGVIGQTWSDTAYNAVPYDGANINDAYLSGYIEYTSYMDSVEGTDFFALSDPMADNLSFSEALCRKLYRQTVTASLMVPEIQRFQLFPWPNRSFAGVAGDYKTIQLQVFNALDEVAGKPVTLTAGTPGIYFAISDSVSWQSTHKNWSRNTNASVYGMTLPLVSKGIPVKMKSLEHINSPSDLEDTKLLLLAYDCQKPKNEDVNKAIADWVKAGGVLLYIGGHDKYEETDSEWWHNAGGTPLQNLIGHLGLDITVGTAGGSNTKLSWEGGGSVSGVSDAVNAFNYKITQYRNSYASFDGADVLPLITANGEVIACEKQAGAGQVILVGIPSASLAQEKGGASLMRALAKYAIEKYTCFDYVETSLITVRRGDILAAHSIGKANKIEGKYIDIFGDRLPVLLSGVDVPADDSVLLYDISALDLSVPRLAYTGGKLTGKPKEAEEETAFAIYGPANAMGSSRIIAPKGIYPMSVSAKRDGNEVAVYRIWDNDTSSLLVQVDLAPEPVEIAVKWGKDPVPDDPEYEFGYLTVKTNSSNEDKDFLIFNTAGANSSLRFCDLDGRLIYKFDLEKYPEADITLNVFQNYILEYSLDGQSWTVIADYSKFGKWTDKGDNPASYSISAVEVGAKEVLYIRLRNTTPTKGWGGSITSFSIRYLKKRG